MSDWNHLIEAVRVKLIQYPDDKRVRFRLNIKNGSVFGKDPGETDYRDYLKKSELEQTEITKIFSRIELLRIGTKYFSTLSLTKVFPWTQMLQLPNAECISGALEEITFGIRSLQELRTMEGMTGKPCPRLESVFAPKVTKISNAAFFNFKYLGKFNSEDTLTSTDSECPAIVCTPLANGYFKQDKIPANVRIDPISFKKKIDKYQRGSRKGEIKSTYGTTVKIEACAFQWCYSLQHVSAHASFIGSAAFAASGLKSAHLLLSKDAQVGDDVFFNCFELKECFMMLDRMTYGNINSYLNGLFWNCFALETVCMPNVCYPHFGEAFGKPRKFENPPKTYDESSLTMFTNCFSLKNLDLRHFGKNCSKFLPYWLVQSDHETLINEQISDRESYLSAYWASKRRLPENIRPGKVTGCTTLCPKKQGKQLVELPQDNGYPTTKAKIYAKPYCNINLIFTKSGILETSIRHLKTDMLYTIIETDNFPCTLGTPFFDPDTLKDIPPAFRRFNDAYLHWFVKEEENKSEEKPKNDLLNKKRKCPFVVHGG